MISVNCSLDGAMLFFGGLPRLRTIFGLEAVEILSVMFWLLFYCIFEVVRILFLEFVVVEEALVEFNDGAVDIEEHVESFKLFTLIKEEADSDLS